nr:MAG TPA: hypothetical protein [Caudoviricetes sp.]
MTNKTFFLVFLFAPFIPDFHSLPPVAPAVPPGIDVRFIGLSPVKVSNLLV